MKALPLNAENDLNLKLKKKMTEGAEKIEKSGIFAPEIIRKILFVIRKYGHYNLTPEYVFSVIIALLAKWLTAKRVKLKEFKSKKYPNFYFLAFAPSGTGKDRIFDDLNSFLFKPFYDWFEAKVTEYTENKKIEIEQEAFFAFPDHKQAGKKERYIKEKMAEIGVLIMEITDGTREGLYRDAKAFSLAGFGSLFVKHSEFLLFAKDATSDQKVYFDQLNESYNGKIASKSIKGEDRAKDITDIPVNAFFHSDPTLFQHDFKSQFMQRLATGLARRSIIIFQEKRKEKSIEKDSEKALQKEKIFFKCLEILSKELFDIFEKIAEASEFELMDETFKKIFYPYKLQLQAELQETDEALISLEIPSRELKALKLSNIYACLRHPKEHIITPEDMKEAISSVEWLSKDLKKFIAYKPRYTDKYDCLFNFFLENIDKAFTKTELISKHYREFGVSRDKVREQFDDFIEIMQDIASEKGLFFEIQEINNRSGKSFKLTKIMDKPLNKSVKEIDLLINPP